LSICSTTAKSPRSGSLSNRWTCSPHNDKSNQIESVPTTYSFQRDNECVARPLASQQWHAAMTAERNEVNVTSLLVSRQSPRHGDESSCSCKVPL
jgi:hypothetical protein